MDTQPTIKLSHLKQRVEATDADLSNSTFTDVNLSGATFNNVNLAGVLIHNANLTGLHLSDADLTGASIVDCQTHSMTIDGIAVSDLIATYRAANQRPK